MPVPDPQPPGQPPDVPGHHAVEQRLQAARPLELLGEHVGDKMFLPAIVGDKMSKGDANVILEKWFAEIGMNMLEPLPK